METTQKPQPKTGVEKTSAEVHTVLPHKPGQDSKLTVGWCKGAKAGCGAITRVVRRRCGTAGPVNLRCSSSQLWLNLELPGELLKPCCPGLSPGQLNKNLKPQRIELLRRKYFFKTPPVDSNLQPGIENYDSRAWL